MILFAVLIIILNCSQITNSATAVHWSNGYFSSLTRAKLEMYVPTPIKSEKLLNKNNSIFEPKSMWMWMRELIFWFKKRTLHFSNAEIGSAKISNFSNKKWERIQLKKKFPIFPEHSMIWHVVWWNYSIYSTVLKAETNYTLVSKRF